MLLALAQNKKMQQNPSKIQAPMSCLASKCEYPFVSSVKKCEWHNLHVGYFYTKLSKLIKNWHILDKSPFCFITCNHLMKFYLKLLGFFMWSDLYRLSWDTSSFIKTRSKMNVLLKFFDRWVSKTACRYLSYVLQSWSCMCLKDLLKVSTISMQNDPKDQSWSDPQNSRSQHAGCEMGYAWCYGSEMLCTRCYKSGYCVRNAFRVT